MNETIFFDWLKLKERIPTGLKIQFNKYIRFPLRQFKSGKRTNPNLIIAGAQKSGTTSLYNYLKQHPDFYGALGQEVHYFDQHYDKSLEWYRTHFPLAKQVTPNNVVGESCPDYMVHPDVARRLSSTLPDVKLIFLLRNPIQRAFSHYRHMVRLGRENRPFARALDGEEQRINGLANQLKHSESFYDRSYFDYSYKTRGHYKQLLEPYFEHHDRQRILVLKSEQLFEEPGETFGEVLDFLDLSGEHDVRFNRYNPAREDKTMPTEARERLRNYYSDKNRQLRSMLNWSETW